MFEGIEFEKWPIAVLVMGVLVLAPPGWAGSLEVMTDCDRVIHDPNRTLAIFPRTPKPHAQAAPSLTWIRCLVPSAPVVVSESPRNREPVGVSPSLREQKGLLEQEISLPLLGTVSLRPGRPFQTDPVHHENLLARHGQVSSLWSRILNGPRQRERIYRNTIQFVKNFD